MQRHQFFEFFIRIADLKFKKNHSFTLLECINDMIKYVKPYFEKYDQSAFRKEIFETEPIEILIKFYHRALKDVFLIFS